ncbi:hypothetical protein EVAR_99013_1 [Eumeta japonica]|uniref:Uncharacterized protein n=1 Tax=Eumeta variegata TaxID=151549 RepID=A0A4C1Y036_EUMVA|nr:hypothetical protein EVAR_99013_1 [Eumeta japonica]
MARTRTSSREGDYSLGSRYDDLQSAIGCSAGADRHARLMESCTVGRLFGVRGAEGAVDYAVLGLCVCVDQSAVHVAGVRISVRSCHDDTMTIQTSSLTSSSSINFSLFFSFYSGFSCIRGSLRDGFRRRCRRQTTYERARIIAHAHTGRWRGAPGMRGGNRRRLRTSPTVQLLLTSRAAVRSIRLKPHTLPTADRRSRLHASAIAPRRSNRARRRSLIRLSMHPTAAV